MLNTNVTNNSNNKIVKIVLIILSSIITLIALAINFFNKVIFSGGLSIAFDNSGNIAYLFGQIAGSIIIGFLLAFLIRLFFKKVLKLSASFYLIFSICFLLLSFVPGGDNTAMSAIIDGNSVTSNNGITVTFSGVPEKIDIDKNPQTKNMMVYFYKGDSYNEMYTFIKIANAYLTEEKAYEILENTLTGIEDGANTKAITKNRSKLNGFPSIQAFYKQEAANIIIPTYSNLYEINGNCVVLSLMCEVDNYDKYKAFLQSIKYK